MKRLREVKMEEIHKAVARECLIYNDTSKKRITEITEAYMRELKKEGYYIVRSRDASKEITIISNAVRVNYFIENGTFNNTN